MNPIKKILFFIMIVFILMSVSCGSQPKKDTEPSAANPPAEAEAEPNLEPENPVIRTEEDEHLVIEDNIDDTGIAEEPLAEISELDFSGEIPVEEETPSLAEAEIASEPAVTQAPLPVLPPPPDPAPLPEIDITPEEETEIAKESSVSDELSDEFTGRVSEAPRESYRPSLPQAPAHTPDSLLQMGLTPIDRELIYSRIIHANVGQIIEIPFRGTGWIYLGELASRRGITYSSRRSDPEGQSFIFTLEEAGTYTLKFYRQDFIRDYIINDHVKVVVTQAPAGAAGWFQPAERGRVVAQPRWPSALEEAQIRGGSRIPAEPVVTTGEAFAQDRVSPPSQGTTQTQSAPSRETQTARTAPSPVQSPVQPAQSPSQPVQSPTQPAPAAAAQPQAAATQPVQSPQPSAPAAQLPSQAAPPTMTSEQSPAAQSAESQPSAVREKLPFDETIKKAKDTFEGGNTAAAIALLEQLMEDYPAGNDDIYWQLGQYYEANSPSRNILLSIDYYRRLVNEYPQSSRYNDARRRIAYLERFYINIQ